MVEFALLLPVFATLIFGTFSGAQAYNQKLTIVAAAREATRYAATLPFASPCNTASAWLGCVESAAVQTATGQLNTTVAGRSICISYINVDTGSGIGWGKATYTTSDSAPSSGPTTGAGSTLVGANACDPATSIQSSAPQVQVVVSGTRTLNVVLWSTPLTITGKSISRYERSTS